MSAQTPNKISNFKPEEFRVKSKKDYHEALDRSGVFMPPLKASGVTIAYLTGVDNKDFWCPLYTELQIRSCYNPPKKEEIFIAIEDHLEDNSTKTFGFSDASKVTADWMIICLSTLNPDHEIFGKYYGLDSSRAGVAQAS